jgi:hypothetical protein
MMRRSGAALIALDAEGKLSRRRARDGVRLSRLDEFRERSELLGEDRRTLVASTS